MIRTTIMLCMLAGPADDAGVGADQFARLVASARSPLRDLSFDFEGRADYVGPPDMIEGDPGRFSTAFQGSYTIRDDGATQLDVLSTAVGSGGPPRRKVCTMVADRYDNAEIIQDADSIRVQESERIPGILYTTGSPENINFFWLLRTLDGLDADDYRFVGWEEVDGRRCIKVEIDGEGRFLKGNDTLRLWIDMERGAQPLAFEVVRRGQVVDRTDRIELARFESKDGGEFWLPVAGRKMSYIWEGKNLYPEPAFLSKYAVLAGSVAINVGKDDRIFKLDTHVEIPKERPRKAEPKGPEKRRAELERNLAEANRQSEELEASSPARDPWSGVFLTQVGVAVLAVGLLVGAVYLRARR